MCISKVYTASTEFNLCYINRSYNGQDIEIDLDHTPFISASYRYKKRDRKKRAPSRAEITGVKEGKQMSLRLYSKEFDSPH